ncbi:MAG: phosphate ABC transporter permease subunit PstC [Bacteroidota bacterium]
MKSRLFFDKIYKRIFFGAAFLSVFTLLGIFGMLLINGLNMFSEVSVGEFLLGRVWNPAAYGEAKYGILAMMASTGLVTIGAMAIAIPLGIGTAAYLSEISSPRLAAILKPIIEILAAIPSVAIGFLGIVLVGPFLANVFGLNNGLNALNGALLLAVMALPTIITVAEDAIRAVPKAYKEGSYALGANKWTTLIQVTLPSSYSGIIAAVMLGMGRAIGETMTVLMATGNATSMPEGYFSSIRTMTATIAIELGEVPFGTTHYYSLFAIGTVLFLITLAVNLLAERIAASYRKMGQ